MRCCKVCGLSKDYSEFPPAKGYADGIKPQCRPCFSEMQRWQRTKVSAVTRRGYWLKHKYDITLEDEQRMLTEQGGLCAICRGDMGTAQVDHCHTTGKVRGLLCRSCNTGLGHFREDATIFAAALNYLKENA